MSAHREGKLMTELQVIARYTISAGQQETVLSLLPKLAGRGDMSAGQETCPAASTRPVPDRLGG